GPKARLYHARRLRTRLWPRRFPACGGVGGIAWGRGREEFADEHTRNVVLERALCCRNEGCSPGRYSRSCWWMLKARRHPSDVVTRVERDDATCRQESLL